MLTPGTIVEIYLIADGDGQALLYAPQDKTGCGCFIVAEKHPEEDYYVDSSENWVNWD